MTVKVEGKELVIRLPLNEDGVPSKTGKTLVVASSHGNKTTEAEVKGKKITVGVNAYIGK
jgi:hypothetical protein